MPWNRGSQCVPISTSKTSYPYMVNSSVTTSIIVAVFSAMLGLVFITHILLRKSSPLFNQKLGWKLLETWRRDSSLCTVLLDHRPDVCHPKNYHSNLETSKCVPSIILRRPRPFTNNSLVVQTNIRQLTDKGIDAFILPIHQLPTAIEPLISHFFMDPTQRSLRPTYSAHDSVFKVSPRKLESLIGLGTQFDGVDVGCEEDSEVELGLGDVAALSYDEYFALKTAPRTTVGVPVG
ncbi:hypothetical protein GLAREA_08361 [Glarea lozoyensis ATCC 20868]|uniref:Uncharacterized protein n=1 Tax=Glarea lozoyensis (strain ATCC 20868 / MF5171) TaxID=1116229 RepID=S3CGU2_GLAL2|nr:uncharacterized protein GLAREA_08361 [Glarea lozoyensis ATCC 20868]EPE24509.1 hypothetical protein GLAREA_08361 [Glarea lozoyensis ATCC 20868]